MFRKRACHLPPCFGRGGYRKHEIIEMCVRQIFVRCLRKRVLPRRLQNCIYSGEVERVRSSLEKAFGAPPPPLPSTKADFSSAIP